MSTGHYAIRPAGDEYLGTRRYFFPFSQHSGPKRWSPVSAADPPRHVASHARSMQTLPTLPSFSLSSLLSFTVEKILTSPPPVHGAGDERLPRKVNNASVPNGCAAEREEELPTRPALPTTRRPHRPLQAQRRVHPGAHTCRSCWVRRHGGACNTDDSNGGAGTGAGGGADAGPS